MKDRVDILLSVYDPNIDYLIKQLKSLNNQTYDNLKLYVFDDCVDKRCNIEIFERYITNFEYEVLPYESKNLGYIKAFEKLIKYSTGKYIAFCDQDDIWMSNKIEKCIEVLRRDKSLAVASERQIIDENDNIIWKKVRDYSHKNYDSWHSFDDIAKYNLFITFAVGMSIVACGDFTRSTLPISSYTAHDKWILSCAATEGTVSFIEEPLVQYRRHGKNVSGILKGINTKEDYIKKRLVPQIKAVEAFQEKYPNHKDIREMRDFANAGKNGNIVTLFRYRKLAPDVAKFNIVFTIIPNFLFKYMLKIARKFG